MQRLLSFLKKHDGWLISRMIAHSRLPQVASVIPTLGYLILWSDAFDTFLKSSKLNIAFNTWRLQCIWWGAVFLLVGLVLYWIFCPRSVKRAASAEDYVAFQYPLPDSYRLSGQLRTRAQIFVNSHEDKKPEEILLGSLSKHVLFKAATAGLNDQTTADLLRFEWEDDNTSAPFLRRSTGMFLIVGGAVFLIPSLEVTCRVLRNLLAPA